ncbi:MULTISPECIES: hypothetical protein [unclassified Caulobacter]|uniref:hypothetical protein n=1 Tax=unclassified Caulobacter TaxID=2648921 RepID=UPI001304AB9C|nr:MULTISPECIES: hypothetical protein [unclassified Caulobacter]
MLTPLIFIGVTDDCRTTFVDLDVETVDPQHRAQALLAEHRSCQEIEIWRDEERIAVVTRSPAEPPA